MKHSIPFIQTRRHVIAFQQDNAQSRVAPVVMKFRPIPHQLWSSMKRKSFFKIFKMNRQRLRKWVQHYCGSFNTLLVPRGAVARHASMQMVDRRNVDFVNINFYVTTAAIANIPQFRQSN